MQPKKLIILFLSLIALFLSLTCTVSAYRGDGYCIAVLSDGFQIYHETMMSPVTSPKLTKETVDGMPYTEPEEESDGTKLHAVRTKDESFFVTEKVPFAFDYTLNITNVSLSPTQGTMLMAAAAGDTETAPDAIPGTASGVQILAMAVCSHSDGKVIESCAVKAVEDAIRLGADVICLGFTEDCGSEKDMPLLCDALKKAVDAGIIVTAAAGDTNVTDMVSTGHIDNGTIASPAVYDTVTAVSSAKSNVETFPQFAMSDGTEIPYSDYNMLFLLDGNSVPFDSYLYSYRWKQTTDDGGTVAVPVKQDGVLTVAYEIIDGLGTKEDFQNHDLTNKIAVVQRGELTFNEKAANAANRGAVGLIVYDNETDASESLHLRMDLSTAPIRAILISAEDGEKLKNAAVREITFGSTEDFTVTTSVTPVPSEFSSRGVTPSGDLKPDVTVVGEDIWCVYADSGYTLGASTAIAAAKLAGYYVIAEEYLSDCYGESVLSKTELAEKAKALVVSAAKPMIQENGCPYSPRVQGGGYLDGDMITSSDVLLTLENITDSKEGLTTVIVYATLENLSSQSRTLSLSVAVGSDKIMYRLNDGSIYDMETMTSCDVANAGGFISDENGSRIFLRGDWTPFRQANTSFVDGVLNCCRYSDGSKPLSVRLSPNETKTVRLCFTISRHEYRQYSAIYENGFYIDGFITVTDSQTDCTVGDSEYYPSVIASAPFSAFSGNWSAESAVNPLVSGNDELLPEGVWLYRKWTTGQLDTTKVILGTNPCQPLGEKNPIDTENLYFSSEAEPMVAQIYCNLGLRRNIHHAVVKVYDESQTLVYSQTLGNFSRTYYDSDSEKTISPQILLWDGSAGDNAAYFCPDGVYTIVLSYQIAGTKRSAALSFTVCVDTEKPVLNSYRIGGSENQRLYIEASDNIALASVSVSDGTNKVSKFLDGSFNLTDLSDRYIYIEINDYALNTVITRIENPLYIE